VTAYRFVQGIDYGPRKGTLGLSFHMAEGGDGTLGFLARHPGESMAEWIDRVNGVSANAVCLSTGEVVQMLDWGHASGNLNPADRAGEYGYYGHHHLVDVLGDHWRDPNTWTISMEIAGFRAAGPTDAQVRGAIAWAKDMKARYPSLRGATGHHDQSPKPCPGLTANMKAIFAGVGGHGLWSAEEDMDYNAGPQERWLLPNGGGVTTIGAPRRADGTSDPTKRLGYASTPGDPQTRLELYERTSLTPVVDPGGLGKRLFESSVLFTDPTGDCAAEVAAEHERTKSAAITAVEAIT
jgi:hypothetical protein